MARRLRKNEDAADAAREHLNGADDERQELSNSKARASTIREAARWLMEHEAEVKALREDIAEYKSTHIKGDLGFKLSDWNTVYRLYKLEDEDRDKLIDTIREGFAALGIGTQSNFLDAMEEEAETAAA